MPLRALFLDVGHTLLREEPSRYAIYAEVAAAHGRPVTPEDMRTRMGRAHHELPLELEGAFRYSDPWFRVFIERIFGAGLGLGREPVATVTEELFRRFEAAETFRLYPGVGELLDAARRRGLHVAVISNWSARLPRVLAALQLDGAFDALHVSALEGLEKPDPALFRRALETAGVAPGEALHAGDNPLLDARAALAVGLQAVLVDHGGRGGGGRWDEDDLEGLERVPGLRELRGVILERA
jgi:REG-2-like HAD superfamily hydrolase